jgi:hypothetical protein
LKKTEKPLFGQTSYIDVNIEKNEANTDAKAKESVEYKAVLALGSNIGDRKQNIQKALEILANSNCTILKKSKLYETSPVGLYQSRKIL